MNATIQPITRTLTQEADQPASLLNQILDRVDAIAVHQSRPSPIRLSTWAEIEKFAEKAARSGMVPLNYQNPSDRNKTGLGADGIVIAVMMGAELGLAPMQALQNIAVVNGRPSVWGDALPALCRASGMVRMIREWSDGEGDDLTFYCEAIRKDDPNPVLGKFSVADAKRANLWKETPKIKKQGRDGSYEVDSGPWYAYPRRMLQMRARGFCLRDAFPDVLKGLITAEEAGDIPFEATGLTPRQHEPSQRVEATAEPAPTEDRAKIGAETLARQISEAPDLAALEAITGNADIVKKRAWLVKNRIELADLIDLAVNDKLAAFDVVEDAPTAPDDDGMFPGDRP